MNHIYKFILTGSLIITGLFPSLAKQLNPLGSAEIAQDEKIDTVVVNLKEASPMLDQKINYGFMQKTKKEDVASSTAINMQDYITINNSQSLASFIAGFLPGVIGDDNIRGVKDVLYVVDGIPGRDIDNIRAEEVEQIAVLKDVNALALYGSQARNSAIVITTRRGKAMKNKIEVNASYGVKMPIMYPDYLGSAEYMELYNEARINDGLSALYDEETIANTRSGINKYQYPDVDFYSSDYLKSYANQTKISTNFFGGNDKIRYFVNLDYSHEGSLEKLNPDANRGKNQYKLRGNLDFKINDWINSTVDVMTILSNNRKAHQSVLTASSEFRPNLYAPLLPVSMVSSDLSNRLSAIKTYDGYILGGSNSYTNIVPIADIYAKGYEKSITNVTQITNTLDFNLDKITKGLTAKTYINLDYLDAYLLNINNTYNYYQPGWENDSIVSLQALGQSDRKDQTENVSQKDFAFRYGLYGQLNYKKQINKDHSLSAMVLGYYNSLMLQGVTQLDKQSHIGLNVAYNYKQKLFADFSSAYSNSVKLAEGHRGSFSPTLGLAYVLSEEDFMKDSKAINFLKLRASAGVLKTDIGIEEYFLYKETFNLSAGTFNWADGARSASKTALVNGRNLDFTFEDRKDISFGLEASLFESLWIEANYFQMNFGNQVTQLNTTMYPSFYTDFIPYSNFNENVYKGFELGINYKKSFGDFTASIGANFLNVNSEYKKIEENVAYDYLSKEGQSTSAILGLVADGFYQTSDFDETGELISALPNPQFGEVKPGDIKYIDQNGDDVIDNNDRKFIGKSLFPNTLGLNLMLKYKSFSFFMLCRAQSGAEGILSGNYYWVDGDDKYSSIVRGRWTEATTATASYPRLSSTSASKNYRNSTFWLYDKSYFDIDRVQLTYELNKDVCKRIGFNNLSINVSGSNLVKFSANKDYLQLNTNGNPQFRYFTIGLRTSL